MNIRILEGSELHEACTLVRNVYDMAIRGGEGADRINAFFDDYVVEGDIIEQVYAGKLIVWGGYEKTMLAGVCAMTIQGHITMLYVYPQFLRRGIAKKLLRKARIYAGTKLSIPNVSVNAIPAYTAGYFARNGFVQMGVVQNEPLYIPMQASGINQIEYEHRSISNGILLGVLGGFFAIVAVIGLAYSIFCGTIV